LIFHPMCVITFEIRKVLVENHENNPMLNNGPNKGAATTSTMEGVSQFATSRQKKPSKPMRYPMMGPGFKRFGMAALAWGVLTSAPNAYGGESDSGLLVEIGPDLAASRTSQGGPVSFETAGSLTAEAWGAGPFGILFRFRQSVVGTNVELSDAEILTSVTYQTLLDLAPTVNVGAGPLRVRIGVGPWFGKSSMSQESIQELATYDYSSNWTAGSFQGMMAEARIDLDLPILSPFLIGQLRGYGSLDPSSILGGAASYDIQEATVYGGVRVNLVPVVKLSLVGFTGYSGNAMDPMAPSGAVQRFGAALWLTIKL